MFAATTRLRRQEGFGLVELLIAMTVLSVGILAVVAGFGSGYVALNRATRISSGAVLADAQMERFRALTYPSICLSSTSTESTHASFAPSNPVPPCSSSDPTLVPIQDPKTGPDNHEYRIDTYVVWNCPIGTLDLTTSPYTTSAPGCLTSGTVVSSPVKLVRIVVLDHATTGKVYAKEESTFDQRSGS